MELSEWSFKFMDTLKTGDVFELGGVGYEVSKIGKYKEYKTITIKSTKENIKFYRMPFFGYTGSPKSKNKNSDMKQNNFIRNVEGQILVDLLNLNNPIHKESQIMNIAKQS